MMRKKIVRTLTTSKIEGFKTVVENGKPEVKTLEPVSVVGKANEKEALKALQEEYGNGAIIVGNISYDSAVYEISVSDFMKYAKRIESAPETEAEEN